MKIPSQAPIAVETQPSRSGQAAPAGRSPVGQGAPASAADQTSWGASSTALTAQAMDQPAVRGNLVEQYRSQIAAGTYQVATAQVATAMLSDPLTGLGNLGHG